MGWISIKEYIQQHGISDSTIRRHIKSRQIKSKRVGSKWFVWLDANQNGEFTPTNYRVEGSLSSNLEPIIKDFSKFEVTKEMSSSLTDVIAFSSKALNSYLVMSDKLINEKEKRIEEKDYIIKDQRQKIAELEAYVKNLEELERRLREQREKPDGWR